MREQGESAPLQVGDHVRVLGAPDPRCAECPHFFGESGLVGHIVSVNPTICPVHDYLVMLARPCCVITEFGALIELRARHFAATELERIPLAPTGAEPSPDSQHRS